MLSAAPKQLRKNDVKKDSDGYQLVTVWIVEFDPLPPNAVGGWDWYYRIEDADRREDELMKNLNGAYKIRRQAMEVPFKRQKAITDYISNSGKLDTP